MSDHEITGNLRDRFIQGVVLLFLLDPVRGEPTVYSLDKDSSAVEHPRELLLKRKFLDSFALICAVRKDAKTVSAACLEEHQGEGTVVRIASNAGVCENTTNSLRHIVALLKLIAVRELDPSEGERIVLLAIVELDIAKIRKYIKLLRTSNMVFNELVPTVRSRLASTMTPSLIEQFLDWFKLLFWIKDLPNDSSPAVLLECILWAQKAKSLFYKHLSLAFANRDGSLPDEFKHVFKLGRYGIAARAFVQTAIEFPGLFDPMVIESVSAPERTQYAFREEEERPLDCTLRRLPTIKVEDAIPRLSRFWGTDDAEATFRESCPQQLVTHAELQLVSFYDHNPTRRPQLRFIGVSKKSCYLCSRFLLTHSSGFYVSSCHQKLYRSWIPAPSRDLDVYKKYKGITLDMSKKIEEITREELTHRLLLKRLMPADSTAGVSQSGLTDVGKPAFMDFARRDGIEINFPVDSETTDREALVRPFNLDRSFNDSRPSSISEMTPRSSRRHSSTERQISPFSSMVLHFKIQSDDLKQDTIMLGSILDPDTQIPSWSMLLDLLDSDDSIGFASRDLNFLLVSNNFRFRNQRQFLACLQWLLNQEVWNSEVLICDI